MRTLPANAEEVTIHNSENLSGYCFTLRTDRLASFFQYIAANRASASPQQNAMPGIGGAAVYGLDCIFFGPKPPRFPALDILRWLRDRLVADPITVQHMENIDLQVHEVEDALGRWAGTVSQLLADGSERA